MRRLSILIFVPFSLSLGNGIFVAVEWACFHDITGCSAAYATQANGVPGERFLSLRPAVWLTVVVHRRHPNAQDDEFCTCARWIFINPCLQRPTTSFSRRLSTKAEGADCRHRSISSTPGFRLSRSRFRRPFGASSRCDLRSRARVSNSPRSTSISGLRRRHTAASLDLRGPTR